MLIGQQRQSVVCGASLYWLGKAHCYFFRKFANQSKQTLLKFKLHTFTIK